MLAGFGNGSARYHKVRQGRDARVGLGAMVWLEGGRRARYD